MDAYEAKINKLRNTISQMPEGFKKRKLTTVLEMLLRAKSEKVVPQQSNRKGGGALEDKLLYNPTGHIKVDIMQNGKVIDTPVDKQNLVVKGSKEITLGALSGDVKHMLFKNRTIKAELGVTELEFDIPKAALKDRALADGIRLLHTSDVIWNHIDEDNFSHEYSYIPKVSYLEEVPSTDPTKVRLKLTESVNATKIQLMSEIYSGSTNLFIGLGKGKDLPMAPKGDKRFEFTSDGDFTIDTYKITTKKKAASFTFTDKISRFRLILQTHKLGADVKVSVDGQELETLVTYQSGEDKTLTFEKTGLDLGKQTVVKIEHSDSVEVVEGSELIIKEFRTDALDEGMNQLIEELKDYELDFSSPTLYKTTVEAPYTVTLPHLFVNKGSITVDYEEGKIVQVDSKEGVKKDHYYFDEATSTLYFNSALTSLYIGYVIDQKKLAQYDVSKVNGNVTSTTITRDIVTTHTQAPNSYGTGDDSETVFTLGHKGVKKETLTVTVNSVPKEVDTDYTLAYDAVSDKDQITFNDPVPDTEIVMAGYDYEVTTPTPTQVMKIALTDTTKEDILSVEDVLGEDELEKIEAEPFEEGQYQLLEDGILLNPGNVETVAVATKDASYKGEKTNYKRQVIQKDKTPTFYPWYELDKGIVNFVAEFEEGSFAQNFTIREMMLCNGPRKEDGIEGYNGYETKAFSLVRIPDVPVPTNVGIRVTWAIKLMDKDNKPYLGGNN